MVSEKKGTGKLAGLAKMAGVDLTEILKLAEPIIAQSVAKTLGEMQIVETLSASIDQRIKERTDAIGAEVKTALEQIKASQQAVAPGQPEGQQNQTNPMLNQVLATIAQKLISGDSGGGMAGMADMFKGMRAFMEMTAQMYQGPRLAAQKEIIDIMKGGYGIGLDTKQVIDGAERGINKGLDSLDKSTTESK